MILLLIRINVLFICHTIFAGKKGVSALIKLDLLESSDIKHVHMIGIDGISMSGLAEILLNLGYEVSGSDIKTSGKTEKLKTLGAKIYPYHSGENITGSDLVVYTAAIKGENPEIIKARELGIPMIDRAALLGQIMKKYPFSIAVSGTHGKTTTTSMVTTIMITSGFNPTVHIGAELEAIGGTTKIGGDRYFVAEACEYYGSFLKFHPFLGIILNIEFDHADYFRDIEHVKDTFRKFASQVPENGFLVACADDMNSSAILESVSCNRITFGLHSKSAMWSAKEVRFDDRGCASFTLIMKGEEMGEIKLNVPGIHNVNNALAAIAACYTLGCDIKSIRQGLLNFNGAHQRFEMKGVIDGIKVIDDYAHHPSEIKATLKAAVNLNHSRVWCVFQPHTYTRTKFLLDEFASSFTDADMIVVSDIYAAREADNGEVHSRMLVDRIRANGKEAVYISGFDDIVDYLKDNTSPGDLVITMGAGNINKVGEMFLEVKKIMAVS